MLTKLVVRNETGADADAITQVTEAAFREMEISHQTEHFIVKALRTAGALSVSLVAELDEGPGCCLVGHPEYYKKLGFTYLPELAHEGVPPEVFLSLSLDGSAPKGTVNFHAAFLADH